ncbi:MAG: hypothetical protein ACRC6B_03920 [Fusobacteriaceae bacterium]
MRWKLEIVRIKIDWKILKSVIEYGVSIGYDTTRNTWLIDE